ncbi:MAG: histidine phosphatase family protein, partial [Gammaproteobacteria bacterium]|nr:histidine phosphatase family protein [Gammaproteobacteria bacterium]
TRRGRKDAERMRAWMLAEHMDAMPELWISSPATRALETAEILAGGANTTTEPRLYGAWPEDYVRIVHATPNEVTGVALVAHNPAISSFVRSLSGGVAAFPTLGTALYRLPTGWGRLELAQPVVVMSPVQLPVPLGDR